MEAKPSFFQWWSGRFGQLRLDFGKEPHEQRLTLTFNFLSNLIGLLVTLTAIWAISAGVVKSGHLAVALGGLQGPKGAVFPPDSRLWQISSGVVPFLSVLVYASEAFGVAMLIFIAAASFGAIIGFLFGVPRPISESGVQQPVPNSSQAKSGALGGTGDVGRQTPNLQAYSAQPVASQSGTQTPGWQSSTNLTQISDWLTKIIVGVGLVDFHRLFPTISALNGFVGHQLLNGIAGTKLVLPALMLSGTIFGFMYSYLFTQLFLAALMVYSANVISKAVDYSVEQSVLESLSSADPMIAPSSRGVMSSEPGSAQIKPSEPQQVAARRMQTLALDEITDVEMLTSWSRAQALSDNYKDAALGYAKLLKVARTPKLLAEASRVFAQAGDISGAQNLIQEAAVYRDQTEPITRARITFDAANYALYDAPPGGYSRALSLLDDKTVASDSGGGLHILRACANGQRHKFERANMTDAARSALRLSVLEDLKKALQPDKAAEGNGVERWIKYLLDPARSDSTRGGTSSTREGSQDDDDLSDFYNDEEFKSFVATLHLEKSATP